VRIPPVVRRKALAAGHRAWLDGLPGTGLDPTAIWDWSVVERVSTGLVCATVGAAGRRAAPRGRRPHRGAARRARARAV